jgi:uncharacterized RDD family membrane protein YckC
VPLDEAQLDVATPERVAFALPIAGVGHRAMAYLVDAAILFFAWVALYFTATLILDIRETVSGLSRWVMAALVLAVFACQWLYWILWEVLAEGQTPGKKLLKVRVVRDDGTPVGVFESAARNLSRLIDFLPVAYGVGIASMLATSQSRRVGDLLAGTVLIKVKAVDLSRYATDPEPTRHPVDTRAPSHSLTPAEVELILNFLSRALLLEPAARASLGLRMLQRLAPEELATAKPETPMAVEAALRRVVEARPSLPL